MAFVFWLSVTGLLMVFLVYPFFISIVNRIAVKEVNKENITPLISLIIAAYNEEDSIREKIENTISLNYPTEKKEIIVVSDGSTDNTNEIINSFEEQQNFHSIILEKNQGKTNAVNSAMEVAKGEIIVFTDANVILEDNALIHLVNNFADEEVGCVCGQLSYINDEESGTAETGGLYWRYEEFIKKMESKTGSTMGADGSIFAIRKELFRKLEPFLIDDFSTSMNALFQGYRIVFDPEAKAYERHTTEIKDEIKRRRRIANRVFNAISYFKKEFLKLSFLNQIKFLFHKYLRYWAGLFMITAFISNAMLFNEGSIYQVFFLLQLIFYVVALLGAFLNKLDLKMKVFHIPYYFTIMNWMQLLGVIDSLLGRRQVKWNTVNSSRKPN